MEQISLSIKDESKTKFLIDLLRQFDFIEFSIEKSKPKKNHDFFKSAGIWANRNITANEIREKAWKRIS